MAKQQANFYIVAARLMIEAKDAPATIAEMAKGRNA
jgi:hypothetical protein